MLGPWVHGGADGRREAQSRSGERSFGPAAAIDYDETILRFMDRYVRGIDNGVDREPAVQAFVMGENAWREADRWPLPGTVRARCTWTASRCPARAASPGGRPPAQDGFSAFVSDPARPVEDPYAAAYGAHDYRAARRAEGRGRLRDGALRGGPARRRDGSAPRSTSRPRTRGTSTSGSSSSTWLPDGTAFNLMSPGLDVLRASYRDGGAAPRSCSTRAESTPCPSRTS